MATEIKKQRGKKGIVLGSILIFVGLVWLLRKSGIYIPGVFLEWYSILIYIGIFIGISKGFRNAASWILIGIGSIFLIGDYVDIPWHLRDYFLPVLIIVIGLIVIIRPQRRKSKFQTFDDDGNPIDPRLASKNDRIDIVSIFNGVKKMVLSKNFQGGDTVSIFGGSEINLTQADFQGEINLDNVVIFGGLKLIVPRHWNIVEDATCIFGGIEDKRVSGVDVVPDSKTLVLTGIVLFGGVDIVSY